MPWTMDQVDKHYGGLDDKHKRMWMEVANSALKRCMDNGGPAKECEISAIRQAASVVKKNLSEDGKSFYYLTDLSSIELQSDGEKKSSWIEIFRIGKWNHPKHGIIEGSKKLFNDFIDNWKNRVLGREIAFDKTHNPEEGATGWVKDIKIVGDRLKALVEWTPWGVELIEQKGFKYFSPEYRDSYIDKESGKEYKNVLYGGALTNRPFLTNLAPIILSEDMEVFQKCEDNESLSELKEVFWIALQEYAGHDEEKIKNIMGVMQEHMKEMMSEMKTKNGESMVKSIIKTHMQQMMNEIMDNMDWVKGMSQMQMEVKSTK